MSIYDSDDEDDKLKQAKPGVSPFGFNQPPSFASQNVSPEDSASLNQSEQAIDAQRAAKQAALEQFSNQGLTPEVQKIAEGMGGMGSVENLALKEAQPVVQAGLKAVAPYAEEAASGLQKVFPKLQKYFQVGDKIFPAKHTAEAMKLQAEMEKKGIVGANRSLIGPFSKP